MLLMHISVTLLIPQLYYLAVMYILIQYTCINVIKTLIYVGFTYKYCLSVIAEMCIETVTMLYC